MKSPQPVAASRDAGPDPVLLSRARWAFRQRGRGPALHLPHYRNGDCSLEILVGSVLLELREDSRHMNPEELRQWAGAVRFVAEERGQ